MSTLRLTARDPGPTQRVLLVHGELGLADVDRLQEALDEVPTETRDIVIGMEHCEFIDSIALAALLRARDQMAERGRRLVLAGPQGQVLRILEVSGLNMDGFVYQRLDQALGAAD
jgi:anti-anti-sigma factor